MDKTIEKKCEEVMEYRFSNPQKAYDICCEILEQGEKRKEDYEIAFAHLYMGDTLFSLGKFKEALDNMKISERIEKQCGFDDLLMHTYNITAIIYVNQGDGLLGLDYYYKAMAVAKKCGNEVMQGMLYNNIGALLHNVGDVGSASVYFKKGYEIYRKSKEKSGRKMNNRKQYLVNIAIGYLEEKKYGQARKYLDLAEKEQEEESDSYCSVAEINRLVESVRTYMEQGQLKTAIEEAQKVIGLPTECFEDAEAYAHFIFLARCLLEMKDYEDVRKILSELQKIYDQNPVTRRNFQLCEVEVQYYRATGEKEKLQSCYHRYYEWKQQIRKEENNLVVKAIDNRYRLEYEKITNEQLSANTRQLAKTSEIDELTGISNRYGLKKRFTRLSEMAVLQKYKICVCIFDVDEFKSYNDQYGHLKGDECLKEIAQILMDTAKEEYFAGRYGGDEFVVLGINKTDEQLKAFMRKLIQNVNSVKMPFVDHKGKEQVTISIGAVNRMAGKENSLSGFLHDADRNLYQAKKNGKNGYVLNL